MYKVNAIPICPHCGSDNISENLLMKCNCTKGMGRSLQYPQFMCKECFTEFADKKNDKSKSAIKIVSSEWTLEKTDKGGELYLGENKENPQEVKEFKKREWKRLMDAIFNRLYILEWPLYDDLVNNQSREEKEDLKVIEVHLKDGQVITVATRADHTYNLELDKLIESL